MTDSPENPSLEEEFKKIAQDSSISATHDILSMATRTNWIALVREGGSGNVDVFQTDLPLKNPVQAGLTLGKALGLSESSRRNYISTTPDGKLRISAVCLKDYRVNRIIYTDLSGDFQAGLPVTGRHR